jgi:hypothetical protein
MDLYYFHIRDELGVIEDLDGIELPTLRALIREAIRSADEFLNETTLPHKMRFEIMDAQGRPVLVMPLEKSSSAWKILSGHSSVSSELH